MAALSAENLFGLSDTAVTAAVTSQFTAQLQCSHSVNYIFFYGVTDAVNPQDPTFVDNLAAAFVCPAIARSSLYGFAATVNKAAADAYWQTNLADTSALPSPGCLDLLGHQPRQDIGQSPDRRKHPSVDSRRVRRAVRHRRAADLHHRSVHFREVVHGFRQPDGAIQRWRV
jgi:hypothetical protein